MLSYLAQYEEVFGPLRLFGYLTFRMALAAATAFFLGLAIGPWLIARLKRFKMEQVFRDQSEVGKLAELHGGKRHTPTMGGLMIYIALTASAFLWAAPGPFLLIVLLVYTVLTALGFADDYSKITKKSSGGVPGRVKLAVQAALTLAVLGLLAWMEGGEGGPTFPYELWVPFLKEPLLAAVPLFLLVSFFFLVLAGSSNAINLTDGIDGLAIGCTITVALVYTAMAYIAGNTIIADYLFLSYVPGAGELAVVCAAMLGASMAFLWYNAHPAEVFMGDTGSLALGGLIGTVAFLIQQPVTLILVGGIFVLEALSVILQVGSFKLTGRRLFKMAPIHHHFELLGWAESKVVIRFWILSLAFAIGGLATLKLR